MFALSLMAAASSVSGADSASITGVGPTGEIVRLHTGFKFAEGPAADAQGKVYFTDIPNNRIHQVDRDGQLTTVLEDSRACNGLMFDGLARLLACQGGAKRVIAIDVASKSVAVIADQYDARPLDVVPNDLVIDRSGGVYFTDPDARSVFYVAAMGTVTRLIDDLPRPNGVLLSPDEKTLYVLPSGASDVKAFPVESPGKIGAGKTFCKLIPNPKQPGRPGGDGLTVDTKGNLYLTRPSLKLIQVVNAEGATLGTINLPEEPANCAFGGKDWQTLYVTAQTSLYAVPMESTGHRFGSDVLAEGWDYAAPMKKVAAHFRGREGVVLHVGGSMTIANPYGSWPRRGEGKTPDDEAILRWMHTDKQDQTDGWWLCRTELEHYLAYTAESGLKSAMLLEGGKRGLPTLAKMLDEYQPRIVTIECGIYDVEDGVSLDDYRSNMARAIDLIIDRGAIPILNTIPPFKAKFERTRQFNAALRTLAAERGIPVIDLEREILARRPEDWFGPLMDRIHLTATSGNVTSTTEPNPENLKQSGYLLRGWLTVRKVAEVKRMVLDHSGN